MVVLFAVLEMVGISLTILAVLCLQPPSSIYELRTIAEEIPRVAGEIFKWTAISTSIYSFLVIWLGFKPNRRRGFRRILVLCAGLAFLFALASMPIVFHFLDIWSDYLEMLKQSPAIIILNTGMIVAIAIFAGIVSALVLRRFFKILDRKALNES